MSKHSSADVLNTIAVGLIVVFIVLLIPRVLAQVTASNARVRAQNSPMAAADNTLARLIGAGGDIGVGLIDRLGGRLIDAGGSDGEE